MAGNLFDSPDTCFQVNFKMSKSKQNPKKTDKVAVLIPLFGQYPTPENAVAIEKDFPLKMEQII